MKNLFKSITVILAAALMAAALASCGSGMADTDADTPNVSDGEITVISREDGSGTRGAFIELFKIEESVNGEKVDNTTDTADITNSTSVMMTSVAGNTAAIGYISMGSLNDTVKALKVDGSEPSAANVKNGSYKVSRPFNIVTKDTVSEAAQDFIAFIGSAEGQKVTEDNKYISAGNSGAFAGTKPSGKIVVSGSSSVTPVMEKLKEAYIAVNPNVTIEVQQSDSTTGINNAIDGVCDIGMASRELKDSESEKGVKSTAIALDGIAVIVNKENTISDITSEQVRQIYTGDISEWGEIK